MFIFDFIVFIVAPLYIKQLYKNEDTAFKYIGVEMLKKLFVDCLITNFVLQAIKSVIMNADIMSNVYFKWSFGLVFRGVYVFYIVWAGYEYLVAANTIIRCILADVIRKIHKVGPNEQTMPIFESVAYVKQNIRAETNCGLCGKAWDVLMNSESSLGASGMRSSSNNDSMNRDCAGGLVDHMLGNSVSFGDIEGEPDETTQNKPETNFDGGLVKGEVIFECGHMYHKQCVDQWNELRQGQYSTRCPGFCQPARTREPLQWTYDHSKRNKVRFWNGFLSESVRNYSVFPQYQEELNVFRDPVIEFPWQQRTSELDIMRHTQQFAQQSMNTMIHLQENTTKQMNELKESVDQLKTFQKTALYLRNQKANSRFNQKSTGSRATDDNRQKKKKNKVIGATYPRGARGQIRNRPGTPHPFAMYNNAVQNIRYVRKLNRRSEGTPIPSFNQRMNASIRE